MNTPDEPRGRRRGHRHPRRGGPRMGEGMPMHRGRGEARSRTWLQAAAEPRAAMSVRPCLMLLAEEPMHGYQLMQAIADRSGGRWTPSPGAIYPTINQLEDEGLVTVTAEAGRKLVTLTDAGREYVEGRRETATDPVRQLRDRRARERSARPARRVAFSAPGRSPAAARKSSAPRPPRSWPTPAARSTCCWPTARRPPNPETTPSSSQRASCAGEGRGEGGQEGVGLVAVAVVVRVEEVWSQLAAPRWADVAGEFGYWEAALGCGRRGSCG